MIPGSALSLLAYKAASSYQISRSLRFNSADSAYLSRTPGVAGNRKTWTWAGWVKRSGFFSTYIFTTSNSGSSSATYIYFDNNDRLVFWDWRNGANGVILQTNAVFRDTNAWLHVVCSVNYSAATAADRAKFYVNGVAQTYSASSYPLTSEDSYVNATVAHYLAAAPSYLNGYLADVHFIDGQALTPSSFGQFDSNNVWQPKAYTGTYGTNGFKLNFSDNSAATATTLGKDSSGNSNNWTPSNLSVTAGSGNDSLVDSPTNYGTDTGVGGEVRGNYAVLNPLTGSQTLANGNLDFSSTTTDSHRPATIAMTTGKWYCEMTTSSIYGVPGLVPTGFTGTYPGQTTTSWGWYGAIGVYNNQANIFSAGFAANDVIQIAFDADSGKLWFGKNGTWLNSGNPAAGTGQIATPGVGTWCFAAGGGVNGSVTLNANFGQRPFAYTAPSGYKALCSTNLPTPTILNGATAMDVKLYTGNGSTQTISGLGFSPDLVWIKTRNVATTSHRLFDIVRGTGNSLATNNANAEEAFGANGVSSFGATSFNVTDNASATYLVNGSTGSPTYAAWCWDAGSSTVTNTAGTISSQVRANASAGFSVVTWTGAGGSQTVGHGLGVAPAMIIAKNRSTTNSWAVWVTGFTANEYLVLNSTSAKSTFSTQWGSTPTSSVFGVADSSVNGSGNSIVAYCFAPVSGYSAFGSYTGNGSADGPFVYTGFRPRWVMVKATATASSWLIYDSARDTYNVMGKGLYPDLTSSEADSPPRIDFLSNGFKIRVGGTSEPNYSGAALYCAFAENPFSISRAR